MDLNDLKNLNMEDIKAKVMAFADKKTLIKIGISAGSIIFFLIIYYAILNPIVKEKKATFSKSEPDPFYIKCDVHPWMKTWVLVSDHPYFAVTDEKGNFSIDGIPAGTYEVVCWQEKFGKRTLTAEVTIGDGDTTKDFVFTRPKKK